MSKPDDDSSRLYKVSDRNRIKRRPERAHYDVPTVHGILNEALICHIAYVDDGQPYCTPTAFWRVGETLFWHGSRMSRMLRAQSAGLSVCVTVSHVDYLVLARSAFGHSINYRSAMLFGTAQLIDDRNERLRALHAFIHRFYPGRARQIRAPTVAELGATSVIAMPIEQASAKIRDLAPHEEKEDDYSRPVWAGLIPISTVVGVPVACPRMPPNIAIGPDLASYRNGDTLGSVLSLLQRGSE